jgi:hypothetical protein
MIRLAAQGLVGGRTYIPNSTDINRLQGLRIQSWRGANDGAQSDWAIASSQTGNLTFSTVHGYWQKDPSNWVTLLPPLGSSNPGLSFLYAYSPWDSVRKMGNWNYFDYVWMPGFLNKVKTSGQLPAYWDLMNECDGYESTNVTTGCYYHSALFGTAPTLDLVERELQHAYADIRAWYGANNLGIPKFVVPSLSGYNATSFSPGSPGPTLPIPIEQLLSWSDAAGLHWDAISWHEIQREQYFDSTNDAIPGHIQQVRTLLAGHPSLSGTRVFINENGVPSTFLHAGWDVGRIWGLESGGVDEANRACWPDPNHPTQTECYDGSLDGLLAADGFGKETLPRSVWWVNCEYAQMNGAMVIPTATSDHGVRALGSIQSATHTIQLLVGRHSAQTAGPTPVTLQVTMPSSMSSVNVFVQRIPDSAAAPEPLLPAASPGAATVTGTTLTINLASVADNDAYVLTITTSSSYTDPCLAVG